MGDALMILEAADILMVEDNAADVELTQYMLKKGKLFVNLYVAVDGVEAMAFLRREGKHAEAPRPDLILLDLNLPGMDGREVLAEVKSDPNLKAIPVVVLTTSQSEQDITKCYQMGANCFITKPVGTDQFDKVVNSIEDFWFAIVRLPQK
jgi:two-component system, chemotaxis family, response regulator Rcp1